MEEIDWSSGCDSKRVNDQLDDQIIDEVLSFEDDRMIKRKKCSSITNQSLPVSYNCTESMTLTSPLQRSLVSKSGAIPVTKSSLDSDCSGSPVDGIAIVTPACRQVVSSSAPTSSLDMEALVRNVSQEMGNDTDFYRDRRKKDIHNMIERRRRYNINDRIKELGLMLPKGSSDELKLNKGTILKASCDYIRQLQKDRELMLIRQQYQVRLEQTARLYAERVKELENQMQKCGLVIPPRSICLPPLPLAPFSTENRPIKKEPFDEMPSSSQTSPYMASTGYVAQLSDTTAAMAISSTSVNINNNQENGGGFSNTENYSPTENSYSTTVWPQEVRSPIICQSQNFSDLMIEEMSSLQSGCPIIQGDPMISSSGGDLSPSTQLNNQLSSDIQWDQANFSPDNQTNQVLGTVVYQQQANMDFT